MLVYLLVFCLLVWVIRLYTTRPGGPDDRQLSWASKTILKDFNKLPPDNQPYSQNELKTVLVALDIAHGMASVNEHFMGHYEYDGAWACGCGTVDVCPCADYHRLDRAVKKISTSLTEQARALEVAGVAGDLSRVAELTARLHEESKIISSVTEAVTQ